MTFVTDRSRVISGKWLLRHVSVSYESVAFTVAIIDGILVVLSSIVSSICYNTILNGAFSGPRQSLGVGVVAGITFLLVANYVGLLRLPVLLSPARSSGRAVMTVVTTFLILTCVVFLLHLGPIISRFVLALFFLIVLVAAAAFHWLFAMMLISLIEEGRISGRKAFLLGDSAELDRLDERTLLIEYGLKEVQRVRIPMEGTASAARKVDEAVQGARHSRAEGIVLAIPWRQNDLLTLVRERLRASMLPVYLLPDAVVSSVVGPGQGVGSPRFAPVELQRAPLSVEERRIKRLFDLVAASTGLVLISPLLILTALAIKLDSPGPVLFRQRRTGLDGWRFKIYKFRTMNVWGDGDDVQQAKKGDQRVTRLGAFLRRTSIDELPQLFNVIKGDMSLVGPRPHAIYHDQQYQRLISGYAFRFHVKPGMTGWAQVNGHRGETSQLEDMEARIDYDLWYVNNWSFLVDLWILVRTALVVMHQKAY